jgi:hypothetical protein
MSWPTGRSRNGFAATNSDSSVRTSVSRPATSAASNHSSSVPRRRSVSQVAAASTAPRLQIGTVTQREAVCWLGGDINAAAGGLRGCYFTMPAKAGAWSLDGWVNWDENNDGEPPFGPRYTYGSPIINR